MTYTIQNTVKNRLIRLLVNVHVLYCLKANCASIWFVQIKSICTCTCISTVNKSVLLEIRTCTCSFL